MFDFFIIFIISICAVTAIRLMSAAISAGLIAFVKIARWVFKPMALFFALALTMVSLYLRSPAEAMLNYVATRFISPVVIHNTITEEDAFALRAELRSKVDAHTYEQVMAWTDSTSKAIGCSVEDILAVALLECGLNPFLVREDKVAAGWLQFTRVGLVSHKVSLDRVIRACKEKDVEFIMSLSHLYLTQKANRSSKPVNTAIDVYLAVFAPSKIGADGKEILYDGANNPAYYMNKGLDGWKLSSSGVIYRSARDERITVEELYLAMMRRVSMNTKKWSS